MRTLNWAYGVTTVPSRRGELLPRTLASLRAGGFPEPRLFVDGCTLAEGVSYREGFHLEVTPRPSPNVRTFGNWLLSLWELYLRHPQADRYALFQDDFVCYRNLRQYLERTCVQEKAYYNLYTMPSNQEICPREPTGHYRVGWYRARELSSGPSLPDGQRWQTGRGAVALVFTREGVTTLLTHLPSAEHLAVRPQDRDRGHRAVDGAVVTAMNKAGWSEYCHHPSLTQHTGAVSSMGSLPQKAAESFGGEEVDALDLLQER